ncbi:MAG: nucleotidyl transferase AbiEii/AbiGii toxin family protein [Clostridia bacterium]|nr:nucleotidyl transferase AbiEii/AbiGii toxin family protein [Clostridia bacterium]
MLEDRKIQVWSYNVETVIAEKFESIISRGTLGTRIRDYYDVHLKVRILIVLCCKPQYILPQSIEVH